MGLELLSRWSPEGLLLESPAEDDLSRILEDGPGTNTRALFARAHGWREALTCVASEPTAIIRSRLIVFPQIWVGHHRSDFMVVCANPDNIRRSPLSNYAFFVECDGRVGHTENAEQIRADHAREREIRRQTGLPILRFSGAEVMYRKNEVATVIGAHVTGLAAKREHGAALESSADAILEAVAALSSHRALRTEYTARNSRLVEEYAYGHSTVWGAECNPFLNLQVQTTQLQDSILRLRNLTAANWEDEEFAGAPQPLAKVMARMLAAISASSGWQEQPVI